MTTMAALRFLGDMKVALGEVPEPVPGPDEAVIRVEVSAICGSEKAALKSGHDSNTGHEAAGVVEYAPDGCGFATGDRVGISAVRGCGSCDACVADVEVRCETPRVQTGMHAERLAVAVSTLRHLPPGTSATAAVLMSGDALGVPVRGVRRAPAARGASVLVLGLGPVGLAHTLVRSFLGCDVVAVEPSPARKALGSAFGAALVVDPGETLPGPPPDLVIEASGHPDSVSVALNTVAKGGTVLQSGECGRAEFSPSALIVREVTYVGSWYYAREDYAEIVRLQADGLTGERLVTQELPAADAADAYDVMFSGESGKVVLRWWDGR